MLKQLIIISVILFLSESEAKNWIEVNSAEVKEPSFSYESNGLSSTKISFELSGYFLKPTKDGLIITAPGSVPNLIEGAPDLPIFTTSIQIPELAKMELEVVSSEYIDLKTESILPSKGNITRDINISSVPFRKGSIYDNNSFYPDNISYLRSPYIIRTKRGQAIVFQPFQYNPIEGLLRVHTNITILVKAVGMSTDNPLVRVPLKNRGAREMEEIYSRHFLNNVETNDRYTPLDENGSMLIICHGPFIDAMQPFIDWKIKKGMYVELYDVRNSIILSKNKKVAAIGLENMIIIEDNDGLLISKKNNDKNLKLLTERVLKKNVKNIISNQSVFRPWGEYKTIYSENGFLIKILRIYPKSKISLQYHKKRSEHWVVVQGNATVTRGEKTFILKTNESTFISKGQIHRLANETSKPLTLVEVQTGVYLKEDDIVRLEDFYGRIKKN